MLAGDSSQAWRTTSSGRLSPTCPQPRPQQQQPQPPQPLPPGRLRTTRRRGLLLADGTPTVGGGEDFLSRQPNFFTETAVTLERKVEKWFPRWEIIRHAEG